MSDEDHKLEIALVINNKSQYCCDNSTFDVIDIKGITPVGDNLYIIHTYPFEHSDLLSKGAGTILTPSQIESIISSFPH